MALVLKDRVKETSSTTGTGTITLNGAVTGFQSFAAIGNGNTTYYTISDSSSGSWEVGIGTYTSSGTTLSRTTVLASSNSGSLVNFTSGTKDVFVTYPSSRSIYADGTTLVATNSSILPTTSGGTGLTSFTSGGIPYATSTSALATGSTLTFNGTSFTLTGSTTSINGLAGSSFRLQNTAATANWYLETSSLDFQTRTSQAGAVKWLISDTEQMRLSSTALLVGTTTNTNTSKLVSSGTISQTVGSTQYLVVDQSDIGTGANEIPLNQYLGNLAYQDNTNLPSVGVGAGTAALPSVFNATDTDTGVWFPAANTIAASVGGSERMRLDSLGLLQVGTTSPAGGSQITAYGASNGQIAVQNSTNWSRMLQNAGDLYIDNGVGGSAGNIIFRQGSSTTERVRIDTSGNLLVGLTSATGVAKLQVSGALRTTGFTVATLPAGTVGMRTYVTDALAPSFSATVTGGGAVTIPVFYNGTNWIVA